MNNVYGLTGVIGSGKSTISLVLQKIFSNYAKELHIIEADTIRRYILWESTEEKHILIQKKIAKKFYAQDKINNIDRNKLSSFIFDNRQNMSQFSLLITPYIKEKIGEIILNHDNTIIVWSYFLEEKYDEFLNQPLFFVQCSQTNCYQRLVEQSIKEKDSLPLEELKKRIRISTNYEEKINICKNNNIKYFDIDNNFFNLKTIISLVEQILKVKK